MTRRSLLALGLPALALAQKIGDYRDPDTLHSEGWTSLFNGKDFSGWQCILRAAEDKVQRFQHHEMDQQSTFRIEDGKIFTTGKPNGYIRTIDVFDNYVFHCEVMFPEQGNSGVLIHVQRDAVWPLGIECQLYKSHMGRIFPIQGATLEGGEMIHEASKPSGEWNTYEVYSEEGRIATVVNGAVVGLGSNAVPRIGYICLQSEGAPAQFRDIRVKRYSPAHYLRTPFRP
jgi:hypothetical protein